MHAVRECRRNHGGAGWDQWDTAGGGGRVAKEQQIRMLKYGVAEKSR